MMPTGDNDDKNSGYNEAKALINNFDFSEDEEGDNGEKGGDKDDDCKDIPLSDIEGHTTTMRRMKWRAARDGQN